MRTRAEKRGINFRFDGTNVSIALDETVRMNDANDVVAALAEAMAKPHPPERERASMAVPADLQRSSAILSHPVFNSYHTGWNCSATSNDLRTRFLAHAA